MRVAVPSTAFLGPEFGRSLGSFQAIEPWKSARDPVRTDESSSERSRMDKYEASSGCASMLTIHDEMYLREPGAASTKSAYVGPGDMKALSGSRARGKTLRVHSTFDFPIHDRTSFSAENGRSCADSIPSDGRSVAIVVVVVNDDAPTALSEYDSDRSSDRGPATPPGADTSWRDRIIFLSVSNTAPCFPLLPRRETSSNPSSDPANAASPGPSTSIHAAATDGRDGDPVSPVIRSGLVVFPRSAGSADDADGIEWFELNGVRAAERDDRRRTRESDTSGYSSDVENRLFPDPLLTTSGERLTECPEYDVLRPESSTPESVLSLRLNTGSFFFLPLL